MAKKRKLGVLEKELRKQRAWQREAVGDARKRMERVVGVKNLEWVELNALYDAATSPSRVHGEK